LSFSSSWKRRKVPLVLAGVAALAASAVAYAAVAAAPWPMGGQNINDTRAGSSSINPDNAKHLALKWKLTTHGDVSATPAVVGGALYFPDWAGYMYKVDAQTGTVIWSHQVSEYDGVPGAIARTSPTVDGDTVYIGDQNGGNLIALDTATGNERWSAALGGGNPFAIDTQSPIVYQGVVYVGLASSEEGAVAFIPNYPCCISRGSFSAVDASNGHVLWQRFMVPPGYSGGGVWSSTAAIDPGARTVYVTTGNNYSVPQSAKDCQAAGHSAADCLPADNYIDSIMALDMDTGAVKWATGVQGFDDWNVSCIFGFINPHACPVDAGPDYDFGSGPNLFTVKIGGENKLVVGAGQKSGQYWLLDAHTGDIIWSAAPGPGSTLGGIEWGTATDGKRIYVAETNYDRMPHHLPNGQTITSGAFAALDAATGKVVWKVADPRGAIDSNAVDLGPTAVANGVVYAGSMTGYMYALDANNGKVLWQYEGEGASNAGAAVTDKAIYWGNGYNHLGIPEGSASTSFYAFSLNGN
jgi:polyvinyl alcohol dehydrogenase (cytochrome)